MKCMGTLLGGGYHSFTCKNEAKKDGYCMVHHPESVQRRKEKARAEYKKYWNTRAEKNRRHSASMDLVEICANLTPAQGKNPASIGPGMLNNIIQLARVAKGLEPLTSLKEN